MGTEYQMFNGKEYVSLRRFWNMEGKYKTEKAKNEQLEEENKELKEKYDGLWKIYNEDVNERIEENKKLKEEIEKLKELNEGDLRFY